jgi:MFS family permease
LAASPGPLFYGYYLAAMSFGLGFVSGAFYLYSRGVFVRDQIVDFDITRTEMSLAFTAVQAVGTGFAPILGFLLDRHPIRNVMMTGAVWLAAGFFALSQTQGVVQFALIAAVFIGLGTGTIGTTANSRLLVNWFDRNRGLALAVAIMGYSTAGIVMPPVALYLLDTVGWRGAYGLFGGACLFVALPLVARLVKQQPADLGLAPDGIPASGGAAPARASPARERVNVPAGSIAVFRSLVGTPGFWSAALLFGLMSGVLGGLNLHLFLHYVDAGVAEYQAALILSVTGALSLASKPLVGLLIDGVGARAAALIAAAACASAMVAFLLPASYAALLMAGAVFGLAFGGTVPLQAAVLSRIFPAAHFGRAYGSLRLCMFPLTLTCTPLIGLLYDRSGSYLPAFAIFAVLFAITALVAALLLPAAPDGTAAESSGSSSRGGG